VWRLRADLEGVVAYTVGVFGAQAELRGRELRLRWLHQERSIPLP
jgi:hypothetical protein